MGGVVLKTAVAMVVARPAFAGQVSDSIDNIAANITTVPILINYASFIIGTALGVAGISKLKAHVDNPAQTPIKDGLGRVAAAAMFISLPYVLDMLRSTQNMGTAGVTYQSITTLSN